MILLDIFCGAIAAVVILGLIVTFSSILAILITGDN